MNKTPTTKLPPVGRGVAPVNSVWQNKITGTRVIVSHRVSRATPAGKFWREVGIKLLEPEMPDLTGSTTDEELSNDFQRVDDHQIMYHPK